MIKVYQANTTLLISFDKHDSLSLIDLRHLLREFILKLKFPFANIMVDLKGIECIDDKGVKLLLLGKKLSDMNNSQISVFNANTNVLGQIRSGLFNQDVFFCDHLCIAS
jgi:hypothetical protein